MSHKQGLFLVCLTVGVTFRCVMLASVVEFSVTGDSDALVEFRKLRHLCEALRTS